MEHRQVAVLVLEGNVFELDFSVEAVRMFFGILMILDFRLGIVKLHNLSGCGGETLKLVHDISHLTHRVGDGPDQAGESHIFAHCELAFDEENAAHTQHDEGHQVGDGLHIGEKFQPDHSGSLVCLAEIPVGFVEFFNLIIFPGESLHHAVSGDVLLGAGVHLGKFFTEQCVHGCHFIPEQVDDPENEGGNHQQAEGHFPVGIEEKDGSRREEGEGLDDHADDPGHHMADRIQVSRESRHEIAGAVGAVKGHILALNFVIEVVPDPVKDGLGHMLVDHADAVDDDTAKEREEHHRKDELVKKIPVGA